MPEFTHSFSVTTAEELAALRVLNYLEFLHVHEETQQNVKSFRTLVKRYKFR